MRVDEIGERDAAPVRTHRLTRTDLVRRRQPADDVGEHASEAGEVKVAGEATVVVP